jgi:CRISPR system Cascade subunit CasE
MYLSRLIFNPRSRQVRNELADPYEMHRTVCKAFPGGLFKAERNEENMTNILFRVDLHPRTHIPSLLVQSRQKPDWSFLSTDRKDYLLGENDLPLDVENPAVKEMNVQLHNGQVLAFRLRANPTFKKTTVTEDGEKHKSRLGIFKEDEQRNWLTRKLEAAGAGLVSVNIVDEQFTHGKLFAEKQKDKRLNFLSVQFDGVLQVKDSARFLDSLFTGFGSAKGLGFGLLSVARTQ